VKRTATFDSSLWVHVVYLDLVTFLLDDFELLCTPAVEQELGQANPTGLRLNALLMDGRIHRAAPKKETVALYGRGERAAINLAIERKLLLLIDDGEPYEAAQQVGIEVTNSIVYLVRLYDQDRITVERALGSLAKLMKRGTVRPAWIQAALKMVSEVRAKKSPKKGISNGCGSFRTTVNPHFTRRSEAPLAFPRRGLGVGTRPSA